MTPMPKSLFEALSLFKRNGAQGLDQVMSPGIIDAYLAVKGKKEANLRNLSREERISMYLQIF